MFTNCEDPEFNQVWLRQTQQICVCKKKKKKNWLNVSSLQQRSLDFDPTFKIERREETLHNYAFIEQIYHILIQTSNLLTAIYNAFLLACEQISLTLPPRSQWHFVSSTLIIICFSVFTVGEEIYPVC